MLTVMLYPEDVIAQYPIPSFGSYIYLFIFLALSIMLLGSSMG